MDSHETTMENARPSKPKRVVEFELRMPRQEDLQVARAKIEPLRRAAEDVVLTSIGLSVLASRALMQTMRNARRAGEEAAEHPGPVTRALVGLVGKPGKQTTSEPRPGTIPVLPIANYDTLDADGIVTRLPGLTREQLIVVRDYELAHEKRQRLLDAIDELLEAMS
jgi:hypothetical protein